jgi:holo-[acyl-carrier protein] synthase
VVIGIGLDAVDIVRFRRVIARRPGLVERLFTESERGTLLGRVDPAPGLAARFAAKEAAMKALGVGLRSVGFRDLEIVTAASGAPTITMHGRASELAEKLGVTSLLVSLTHTGNLAGAIVVAV